MLRFLADENLNIDIVRGLLRREPALDIVRVQDVGLSSATDPMVLERAAKEDRVLLTHDVNTVRRYADERVAQGKRMSGVILIGRRVAVNTAIEDLLIIAECSGEGEWEGVVLFLPL